MYSPSSRLWASEEPIITSLLDTDFYKISMGNFVHARFPDVPVRYGLNLRTKDVHLAKIIPESVLRDQLDHVRRLTVNNSKVHYLRGTNEYGQRMLEEPYLESFRTMRLPEYDLRSVNGNFELEFEGPWSTTIYWETPALAIINELYYQFTMRGMSSFERDVLYAEGIRRLHAKIKILKRYPQLTFSDFGTRRRHSRAWQEYVVRTLRDELPPSQFLGTSNVELAMDLGLLPMGTSAHEMFMAMAAMASDSDDEIRKSHNEFLQMWWEQYGWGLSIALTDTFGTDFFFRDFTPKQARNWKGLRQDSGDPFAFAWRAINFYSNLGIDPKSKLLVFSDGLDVETMVKLFETFGHMIRVTFGWGTNLTNDLGLISLSMVIKLIMAARRSTVKLSDNLAKALGSASEIERYKKIFGHSVMKRIECKY